MRGGRVLIDGAAARHLSASLRARAGDTLVVVEAGRTEHGVVLDDVGRDRVTGAILWSRDATGEPVLQVHLLQALPKRGMDEAVEALAEAGAAAIHPMLTRRTVPLMDEQSARRRLERWRSIAREAAQLAGRARPPEVHLPAGTADVCAALPAGTLLLAATVHGEQPITRVEIPSSRRLAIAVGPEGGFDGEDLRILAAAGAVDVHLGPRVLPTRLAGATAVALVLAHAGELDSPPAGPPNI